MPDFSLVVDSSVVWEELDRVLEIKPAINRLLLTLLRNVNYMMCKLVQKMPSHVLILIYRYHDIQQGEQYTISHQVTYLASPCI